MICLAREETHGLQLIARNLGQLVPKICCHLNASHYAWSGPGSWPVLSHWRVGGITWTILGEATVKISQLIDWRYPSDESAAAGNGFWWVLIWRWSPWWRSLSGEARIWMYMSTSNWNSVRFTFSPLCPSLPPFGIDGQAFPPKLKCHVLLHITFLESTDFVEPHHLLFDIINCF